MIAKRVRGEDIIPGLVDKYGRIWTTAEIAARFLEWRIRQAEELTGESAKGVLVTVPAVFNDAQRRATQAIVGAAGFTGLGTLNELAAALMGYSLGKSGIFGIADLGGGTFDILNAYGAELFARNRSCGRSARIPIRERCEGASDSCVASAGVANRISIEHNLEGAGPWDDG